MSTVAFSCYTSLFKLFCLKYFISIYLLIFRISKKSIIGSGRAKADIQRERQKGKPAANSDHHIVKCETLEEFDHLERSLNENPETVEILVSIYKSLFCTICCTEIKGSGLNSEGGFFLF